MAEPVTPLDSPQSNRDGIGSASGSVPYVFASDDPDGIVDAELVGEPSGFEFFGSPGEFTSGEDVGSVVDQTIGGVPRDSEKPIKDEPQTGPPKLDEWMDFFSRVVFRTLCDFYIDFAFRGIDEDVIQPKHLAQLKLTKEERNEIAVPLASYANKSKFLRKHGRSIVSAADSVDALIVLGMWVARVNRIAAKYRPKVRKPGNERFSQSPPNGTVNGHDGPPVVDGSAFQVFNPGTG